MQVHSLLSGVAQKQNRKSSFEFFFCLLKWNNAAILLSEQQQRYPWLGTITVKYCCSRIEMQAGLESDSESVLAVTAAFWRIHNLWMSDNTQPGKTGSQRRLLPLMLQITEVRSNFLCLFHFASDPVLVPNLAGAFSTGSVSICYQMPEFD